MKVAGNIGGSLLSLGSKEKKNFKKIAASVTRKVEKVGGKAKKSVSSLKLVSWRNGGKKHQVINSLSQNKDRGVLDSLPESQQWSSGAYGGGGYHNEDPGVNSDDEDDMFQVRVVGM